MNVGGAAGTSSSDETCDPADATAPPEVIEFDATEYVLFENGAKNYEPAAVTGKDTPNTGPYEPLIEVYPSFKDFTVYRPKSVERLMPIIVWGNGGCAQHGTFHGEFLKELASYGFLIIADGAPGPKDSLGFDGPTSPGDGTQQKKMLDWAFAENERACSTFYHKLDTTKVSVAGNSCGGLMTMYAAPDARVTTAVLFNSGLFTRDQPLYDSLHAPLAIFDGGPDDPASENARADVAAIDNVPIFFANDKRGHGSYLWDDNAGEAGKVGVAWFSWFLLGEKGPKGKGMFVGDDCGMCTNKNVWTDTMWKNEQLLKD